MTTLELNAVAPQTTHRFFELMVPSLTSAAIWSSLDGRAMCVCGARPWSGASVHSAAAPASPLDQV